MPTPVLGLDTASGTTAAAQAIRSAGFSWVGRYLWQGGKGLTRREAQALSNAGLQILSLFEAVGASIAGFSPARARADVSLALSQAAIVGQPTGSVIIFAADDFDAGAADLPIIRAYFELIRGPVLAAGYSLGAYGNGLVLRTLQEAGLIEVTMLAGAIGWHESAGFRAAASVVQGGTVQRFGLSIDTDAGVQAPQGLWSLPSVQPTQAPALARPLSLSITGLDVIRLQQALDVDPDGRAGPKTLLALQKKIGA